MLLPPLDSRDQALRAVVGESGLTFERTPTETWLQQREDRAEAGRAEAGRDGSGEIEEETFLSSVWLRRRLGDMFHCRSKKHL